MWRNPGIIWSPTTKCNWACKKHLSHHNIKYEMKIEQSTKGGPFLTPKTSKKYQISKWLLLTIMPKRVRIRSAEFLEGQKWYGCIETARKKKFIYPPQVWETAADDQQLRQPTILSFLPRFTTYKLISTLKAGTCQLENPGVGWGWGLTVPIVKIWPTD